MDRMKPTFVGIGGQKTASTWTYMVLREHPQICMSEKKEIQYFSMRYDKGDDWYLSFFDDCSGQKVRGEFSVTYYRNPEVKDRIYQFNPSMKILMNLRDPVDRSYSHYRFKSQLGEYQEPFSEALQVHPEIIQWSKYGELVLPYVETFGRENVHFIKQEDIHGHPEQVTRELFEFLEVDPEVKSSFENRTINSTIDPKFEFLERMRHRTCLWVNKHGLYSVAPLIRKSGISNLYRKLNHNKKKQVALNAEQKASLRAEFTNDLQRFMDVTGVDVSAWL
jgi:hypothetical protein